MQGERRALFLLAAARIVFERDLELGAERFDLAVLDDEILLDHFGDAEIAETPRRELDRGSRGFFPGLLAGPDQLQDLIDAVCHCCLPVLGCAECPARAQAPEAGLGNWGMLGLNEARRQTRHRYCCGLRRL